MWASGAAQAAQFVRIILPWRGVWRASIAYFFYFTWELKKIARRAPRCVVAAYLLWLAWLFIEESLVASLRNRPHPLDMLVIVVVPILTLTCGFVVGLGLGIVLSSLGLVVRLGATPAARAVHVVVEQCINLIVATRPGCIRHTG